MILQIQKKTKTMDQKEEQKTHIIQTSMSTTIMKAITIPKPFHSTTIQSLTLIKWIKTTHKCILFFLSAIHQLTETIINTAKKKIKDQITKLFDKVIQAIFKENKNLLAHSLMEVKTEFNIKLTQITESKSIIQTICHMKKISLEIMRIDHQFQTLITPLRISIITISSRKDNSNINRSGELYMIKALPITILNKMGDLTCKMKDKEMEMKNIIWINNKPEITQVIMPIKIPMEQIINTVQTKAQF